MMAGTTHTLDKVPGRRFLTMHVRLSKRVLLLTAATVYLCRVLVWLVNKLGVVDVEFITDDSPIESGAEVGELLRMIAQHAKRDGLKGTLEVKIGDA